MRFYIVGMLMGGLNYVSLGQVKNIGLPDIINYEKTDYKSGTQNWDIDQDKNGNVYFANNNGLLQFDGSEWHTYAIPNSGNIRSIKVDQVSGRIYVGAYNEFGYFESSSNGNLKYISLTPLIQEEAYQFSDFVWKIQLFEGAVIFQAFGAAYIFKDQRIRVLPAPQRFQFSFKVDNKLYFQDVDNGILEFVDGELKPLKGTDALNGSEIWGMVALPNHKMLILTLEAGIFIYDNQKIIPWATEAGQFIKKNGSLGAVVISDDLIAINSVLSGIIISNLHGDIIQHIDLKKGLINNTILSSFIDAKKNLWLGLDNGISFININSPFTYFTSSLNLSSVYASIEYQGSLYVATNQGVFYHKLVGSFKDDAFTLVEGTTAQSWNIQVVAGQLLCANNKGVLIIDDGKVINVLDHKGYFGFKELPSHPNFIIGSNYNGFSIFQKTPNGIVLRNQVQNFDKSSNIFEVDDTYLWLKKDQYLYQILLTEDLQEFSSAKKVNVVGKGEHGIGSIKRINGKVYFIVNNRFFTYSKETDTFKEDLQLSKVFESIAVINSISEDSLGNLWYTHNESLGVFVKNKQGDYTNVLEPFSNLTGKIVVNYLSVNTLDANNIFIGLINGLAHYDSKFSTDITNKPEVFIRSFAFGKDTIFQGNPQQKTATLTLPYSSNNIRFTFSSPEFENTKNIEYAYQLEPFDKQWSKWSTSTLKEYTNLREDNYIMKVKVKNGYGIESEITEFAFGISPPWYRHPFALFLYVGIIILTIYLIRLRMKVKIRKNKYYETIEQRKIYLEKESKIRMEQYNLEKEIEKLNRDKLQTKILVKDKELVNNSLQVVKKNKVLNGIIHKLKEMEVDTLDTGTKLQFNKLKKSVIKEINTDKSWQDLEKHIKNVHFEFLVRLKEKCPTISSRELDLSTYLLMNMSTKEIAEIMNISNGGVELARYRLRKKLKLKRKENLTGFLMNI